jgi:hypothetical protein
VDAAQKGESEPPVRNDRQEAKVLQTGESYNEPFQKLTDGGVSIKITPDPNNWKLLLQFEYTLTDIIYYDGSYVDCGCEDCPFYKEGASIKVSDPSCPSPVALPGVCDPTQFYHVWNDDRSTKGCRPHTGITLHLCKAERTT